MEMQDLVISGILNLFFESSYTIFWPSAKKDSIVRGVRASSLTFASNTLVCKETKVG